MSDIFKVSILKQDRIDKIYVFYGSNKLHDGAEEVSPSEYFKLEPESDPFKDIFNHEELEAISANSINVEFVNMSIRLDDSIEELKRKIIVILKETISFDEIYLFTLKEEDVNLVSCYQNITQDEKLDLTKDRLIQFLLNFSNIDITELEDKSEYTYDDLINLKFSNPEILKKPLGQKFFINELKYQYTVNPFDVITYDTFLEKYADSIVTTLNRSLLLDFGKPKYNNIYCCLAEDVYEYIESANIPNITPSSTAKIYFPFLYKQNIYNLEQLKSNKIALIENNKAIINKYSDRKQQTTDLLYDLYDYKIESLPIKSTGIKNIEFTIHQNNAFILPIDVIFKLVHTSKEIPFIKLNPGNRKEKLYRIYTESISSDGRKIPYLSKANILKLSRDIGKIKRLAIYIEKWITPVLKNITRLEIDSTGSIYVNTNFPDPVNISVCEDIIKQSINPILLTIKEFIEQSGYSIELFSSLNKRNIEVVEIKYTQLVTITKNIHLQKIIGCVSNCFNVIEDNIKKGIVMRYKKVSNFNIMSSQQAMIIELVNKGFPRNEVITAISQNYNIEKDDAEEVYIRFINEIEVERGLYENKRLKIRDNPGFLTTINVDNFTNNIIINVSNIDNILYLETLPKMIFSILAISQNIYNPEYKNDIQKICKKKIRDNTVIVDIVAPVEQEFKTNQKAKINDLQELTYDDDDDVDEEGDDDYLTMLLGNINDDEDEDDGVETGIGGSTPEDDIVIGDDISIGSDVSQEGNIPTAPEIVSYLPSSNVSTSDILESNNDVDIVDSINVSLDSKKLDNTSPTKTTETGDDIEIGDSISMTPEDDKPKTTETGDDKPKTTETGDDIEIGDSISMSPEDDKPKTTETGDNIEIGDSISMSPEDKSKTPEDDIALQTAIHSSIAEQDEFEKHPPADEHERDQINVAIKQQEDEDRMNEEVEKEVTFQTELNKDKENRKGEWDSLDKDKSLSIASSYEMDSQGEKSKTDSPDNVSPNLPTPMIDVRRGISMHSQSSENSDDDYSDSSISVGSDIDVTKKSPSDKEDSLSLTSVSSDMSDEDDFERDITGTQLNNPYYFQARMEKRDPVLFVKSMDDPNFKAYSRMCPSNVRRQPVILTDKEKEKIDREHPGSYSHSVKYGSDPKNQYHFICPRYWCIKDNTSLTEEEVNSGVCGGRDAIIPPRASKIPKGKYIYEFNARSEHKDADGNYIEHAPGFLSKKKHPEKMCLPCCFKNWNAPEQIRRRAACAQNAKDKPKVPLPLKRVTSISADDYIKDETKIPLEQNRWGVLPMIIQDFLNIDKKNCALSGSKIKPFNECLLRHGVEVNKNQSFIGCIADLYVQYIPGNIIPSISEMKKYIIEKMTLDTFMESHNGNLIQIFDNGNEEIKETDYNECNIYKNLDMSNNDHKLFFKKIVNSYKTFIKYLENDDIVIDYKYLWDIVCTPGVLFPHGINLVIIETSNHDITNNIQLICPTNHYSKTFYSARKSSFILLKQGNYYEPLYLYQDIETKIKVQKTFSEYSKLAPNLKIVLSTIKKHLINKCKPLPSIPKEYTFVENNGLEAVLEELGKIKGLILSNLVANYNGKIIGINVSYTGLTGFIPCYPSGISVNSLPIKMIDNKGIWNNYEKTVGFLLLISKKSNGKILCKPLVKITDDELVVGLLTETNQFIQLEQPEMTIEDGIKNINDANYLLSDSKTLLNNNVDEERIKYVKKIRLEKNFYNVFRNTLRILLNKYENRKIRDQVQELINSPRMYYDKMDELIKILQKLLLELVEFVDYTEEIFNDINSVSSCITNNECNKPYCMKTDSDKCKLLIPRINLLNELDNEIVYYAKISDELLRFNRIKLFIFDPKTHLSFNSINYDIHDNEIILLSSLLNQEYFKDLVPITNNKYITTNTYDTANPIKSRVYSSVINTDSKDKTDCKTIIKSNITGKWNKRFNKDYQEIIYPNTNICTFTIIIDILNTSGNGNDDVNINTLKVILLEEYNKLFQKGHRDMIYTILFYQGKVNYIRQIRSENLSFEDYLLSENYYLTNMDIWLLANKFNIGIVLISSTKLIENRKDLLPLLYPENNELYFIKSPGVRHNLIPKYRLICDSNNNCKIKLNVLPRKTQSEYLESKTSDGNGYTLEKFLHEFKPIVYKKKKQVGKKLVLKKKKKKLTLVA